MKAILKNFVLRICFYISYNFGTIFKRLACLPKTGRKIFGAGIYVKQLNCNNRMKFVKVKLLHILKIILHHHRFDDIVSKIS
jgi:hypothetical protein